MSIKWLSGSQSSIFPNPPRTSQLLLIINLRLLTIKFNQLYGKMSILPQTRQGEDNFWIFLPHNIYSLLFPLSLTTHSPPVHHWLWVHAMSISHPHSGKSSTLLVWSLPQKIWRHNLCDFQEEHKVLYKQPFSFFLHAMVSICVVSPKFPYAKGLNPKVMLLRGTVDQFRS